MSANKVITVKSPKRSSSLSKSKFPTRVSYISIPVNVRTKFENNLNIRNFVVDSVEAPTQFVEGILAIASDGKGNMVEITLNNIDEFLVSNADRITSRKKGNNKEFSLSELKDFYQILHKANKITQKLERPQTDKKTLVKILSKYVAANGIVVR